VPARSTLRRPRARCAYVLRSQAAGHPCLGREVGDRDGAGGRLQVVYGLLKSAEGVPVAVEVFRGQHGGPEDPGQPAEKAPGTLRAQPCLPGGRPGDADRYA
jgi:hypothetical protein